MSRIMNKSGIIKFCECMIRYFENIHMTDEEKYYLEGTANLLLRWADK